MVRCRPDPAAVSAPRASKREVILASKVKTQTKRPSKAEQRAETMEQILDTAEHLFSKHGFYGVTLKDVAKRVGVHHTLVNYYFADKQTPFDAVFARRAVVTIETRMKALADYDRDLKSTRMNSSHNCEYRLPSPLSK